jgi:hypothetical protein
LEHATAELTAASDVGGLDDLSSAAALARLLEADWQLAARYWFFWRLPAVSPEQDATRHAAARSAATSTPPCRPPGY